MHGQKLVELFNNDKDSKKSINALTVVDNFAKENNLHCIRFMIPGVAGGEMHLSVFLNNINYQFTFDRKFFWDQRKWKLIA
ncbi:hypothetical protein COB64_02465 [Candidatus Wolfebacteria bacterium]|nr:MAG: hypothetical protein COB64_02465 [Candidatus Wolfebacteria bacterium]